MYTKTHSFDGYRRSFDELMEDYPDYLEGMSDEEFESEMGDGKYDYESGWNESQWSVMQKILKEEQTRREILAEEAEMAAWVDPDEEE